MSGGSFEYLYLADLNEREGDLREMARVLREELNEPVLGNLTEALVYKPSASLREVWKAVEWWKSGDWSKEQVEEVIREFPLS